MFGRIISFVAGSILCFGFMPFGSILSLFSLSILILQIESARSLRSAFFHGYFFGYGFYLFLFYWLAIAVSTYQEFWWAVPIALLGFPAFMALFTALSACIISYFRYHKAFLALFVVIFSLHELVISHIFTGLPWGLLGYILTPFLSIAQATYYIGIMGLSAICIYFGSFPFAIIRYPQQRKARIILFIILLSSLILYGALRLNDNPIILSDLKVKIVSPKIQQQEKWNLKDAIAHLDDYIKLSKMGKKADIIVWPEASVVIPYNYDLVKNKIQRDLFPFFDNEILIFGGVTFLPEDDVNEAKIYSSMIALDKNYEEEFVYHKSHLVPFGEYMPFSGILPLRKITPGIMDYSAGKVKLVSIAKHNLIIRPLICYESIFPFEINPIEKDEFNLFINISNDSWYKSTTQPYQHLEISKVRAIENNAPLIRAASGGISAVFDSFGRLIKNNNSDNSAILYQDLPMKSKKIKNFAYFHLISFCFVLIVILGIEASFFIYKKDN